MAFATRYAYRYINFLDFHVHRGTGDPEEDARDDFGGDLFKYNFLTDAYDPIAGGTARLVPARRLMLTCLARWMLDFRVDGIRMDSVPNIMNWDFVQEYKDLARTVWRSRWVAQGLPAQGADERFLVVGEDLAVPIDLLRQNRLDGLWNEEFKRMVRCAILGQNDAKEPSFEWTVRKLIDCRLIGFADGAQAINYVTSHDVEGFRNERLYNLLNNNGVSDTEPRIKLAFVCLMTAVGIPMIFAGEEFADQHDLPVVHPEKQIDPVNFDRLQEPWRRRVFDHVARLVHFRTRSAALAVNDTEFIHVGGKARSRLDAGTPGRRRSRRGRCQFFRFRDRAAVRSRVRVPRGELAERARGPALARDHAGSRRAARMGRPRADLPVGGQGLRLGVTTRRSRCPYSRDTPSRSRAPPPR